jgi:predicted AlkP superfamily pyrophosphatase or phosphodiesterase
MQPTQSTRLIALSVDGMHPDFYRRPNDLKARLPNVRALVAEGASAEAMQSVYPSTTYPAHATLVTGVPPRVHGIYSHLASLDPTEASRPWHWFARAIRVPALWAAASARGLKTASVSWPVSAGAGIEFNLPEIWDPAAPDPHKDFVTVARHATPGLFEELVRTFQHSLQPAGPDRMRGEAALHLWREHRPDLLLVHFVGYDHLAHHYGPRSEEAVAALEEVDSQIGRLRDASLEGDPVTFVVLSDHGFLDVEKEAAPLVILREEGLFGSDDKRKPELRHLGAVQAGGSFAVFWLEAPPSDEQRALARALKRLCATGAVAEVVDRAKLELLGSDPDAEWMVDAAQGFCFSSRFGGPPVAESPGDRGTHGHLPSRPGMEASFIAAGPGVMPGKNLGRIQLTDVAPTLSRLLGMPSDALATDAEPLDLG